MVRRSFLATLFLGVGGCAPVVGSAPQSAGGRLGFSVRYAVDAMRPDAAFALTIDERGEAILSIARGGATGLVGDHGYRLDDDTCARLSSLVVHHAFDDGEVANAEGSGSIVITRSREDVRVSLMVDDPDSTALRTLLDAIASEASAHPVAALRVSLEERGALVNAVIENVGAQPIKVLLFDPAALPFWIRLRVGKDVIARDRIEALAREGAIPIGPKVFAPKERLEIALQSGSAGDPLEVTLWRPGVGLSLASLVARAR